MTTKQELLEIFKDKLAKTGSLDAAFLKVVWIAYQKGLADGKKDQTCVK